MRDYELPNVEREAVWRNVPTGRAVGTIRLAVVDAGSGAVVLAEGPALETAAPGTYLRAYTTPLTSGLLLETWTDTVTGITTTDELEITHNAPTQPALGPSAGLVYANVGDLRAYAVGPIALADDALLKVMIRAEKQINGYLKWGTLPYTLDGWAVMDTETKRALREAVCAQAEYRLTMSEEFFIETPTPISGPDYTNAKAPPTIGPKARQELLDGNIISHTGTFSLAPSTRERRFNGAF